MVQNRAPLLRASRMVLPRHVLIAWVICLLVDFPGMLAADVAEENGVIVLTSGNFDQVVSNEDLMLVKFYAPWCGHCKNLAPHFESASLELKKSGIFLGKVDVTVHADIGARFDVQGYPTLVIFRNGLQSAYKGGRSTDEIVEHMRKQSGPGYVVLNEHAELKQILRRDTVALVGCFTDGGTDRARFAPIASALRDELTLALVTDSSVADALGVKESGIKLFVEWAEQPFEYFGDLLAADVLKWAKARSIPAVVKVGPNFSQQKMLSDVMMQTQPKVVVFCEFKDSSRCDMYQRRLKKASEAQRGAYVFVLGDYAQDDMAKLAVSLGVDTDTTAPQLIIFSTPEDKYLMAIDDELTLANINDFIAQHQAGTLPLHIKSEPEPDTNSAAVKVVVGTTFDELVWDNANHVLLELYAPWCGHCKALEPKYRKLGKKVSKLYKNESIVVAKMDVTANDLPGEGGKKFGEIRSYPTIKMKMASKKVVLFDGSNEVEALLSFIDKNLKQEARGWKRESPEFPWVPIILAIVGGIAFLAILMYAIFTSLEPPPPQDTADDLADVAPETDADPKKLN